MAAKNRVAPDPVAKERSMKARVGAIALLVTILVDGPTLQASNADGHRPSHKDVVLYELNEQARLTPTNHREADSGLQGKAKRGTPVCTERLLQYAEDTFALFGITIKDASRCTVVAFGHSDLDLDTLQGTIDGHLSVNVNSGKTNLTDAAELVVMTGKFHGKITVTDRVIIKITEGTFEPTAVIGIDDPSRWCPVLGICRAAFTGTFRQPFKVHRVAVYKKDNGSLVPVLPDERALGDPTVRLEITFD
jgi:hypothetical protein